MKVITIRSENNPYVSNLYHKLLPLDRTCKCSKRYEVWDGGTVTFDVWSDQLLTSITEELSKIKGSYFVKKTDEKTGKETDNEIIVDLVYTVVEKQEQ